MLRVTKKYRVIRTPPYNDFEWGRVGVINIWMNASASGRMHLAIPKHCTGLEANSIFLALMPSSTRDYDLESLNNQ